MTYLSFRAILSAEHQKEKREMKIIAGDGQLGSFLEAAFAPLADHDGAVIFLEYAKALCFRQDLPGLDDTLVYAPNGTPIVMLGWQSPVTGYADDPRWHAALGYPNVVFRRLPEGVVESMTALEEAAACTRIADPLAIALLTAKTVHRDIGILQHDLHSAETQGGKRMERWEKLARQVFGDKPQTELIEAAKQPHKDENAADQFAGQVFPDVCVDVEGTLFTKDGVFRQDIFDHATSLANGRPITIWTGGDLETAQKMVRTANIPHKLVPKQLFRGATVGIIIDDLAPEEFALQYGVNHSVKYQQV